MACVSTVSLEHPPSHGGGTSKAQGKTFDPHNWGNSGVTNEKLDPHIQQRKLDAYNIQRSLWRSFAPDKLDKEKQRLALEHWATMKAACLAHPGNPSPISESVDEATPPVSLSVQEIVAPPSKREASVETIATPLKELQQELAELWSAHLADIPIAEPVVRDKALKKLKKVSATILHIKPIVQVEPYSYIGRVLDSLNNTLPGDDPSDLSSSDDDSSEYDLDSKSNIGPIHNNGKSHFLQLKPEKSVV